MTTWSRVPRHRACRSAGAASVEFVVAALVVLPLALAIVEVAQMAVARHALNHGVFEAARAAALHDGSPQVLRRQLARAMMPLFAPADPAEDTPAEERGAKGAMIAAAEFLRPDLASVSLATAATVPASLESSPEVRVLVVRVRYCRELLFPWHSSFWPARASTSVFDLGCRARGRLPIESVAAVHVQATTPGQSSFPP